jgi:hypothetical protein
VTRSDWLLAPADAELQEQLLRGWWEAAVAAEPESRSEYRGWLERRLAHVASGASHLRVGHEDLLVLPRRAQITRTSGGSSSPSGPDGANAGAARSQS